MREVIEMYQQYPWNTPYQQRTQQQWYQPPIQQPMQPAQPAQPGKRVQAMLVTSFAEVEAAQIPFDPDFVPVFVDLAHDLVYIKRFNAQTGGSDTVTYGKIQPPAPVQAPDPVTAQLADLARRVEALEARKTDKKEADE